MYVMYVYTCIYDVEAGVYTYVIYREKHSPDCLNFSRPFYFEWRSQSTNFMQCFPRYPHT